MTQLSPMTTNTETLKTTKSSASNSSTPAPISKDASPWIRPELEKDPRQTLEALRENQLAIKDLEEKNKRLRSRVEKHYEAGELADFVDDNNSQKFNYQGVSATLCPGKPKREWSPEVQQQLDALKQQIKEIELIAESRHQYQETRGKEYWRINLQKEL
jgi:hypothetical protein